VNYTEEKEYKNTEKLCFDRLCNIVDAYNVKDNAMVFRRIKEARKWLEMKNKNRIKN
jgi:hypothetical protein